jgi:hypothetical protein
VDRLTTGRRHVRAGSVTVTELLVKQSSPARCTDSAPPEPDDITETIPVIGAASHRRAPNRGAHLAKLATIGVAGAVLCGAVAISSMVSHHRRDTTQSGERPTVQITGEQALLPDVLDRTLHVPGAAAPVPATPHIVPELPPPAVPRPAPAPAPTSVNVGGTEASGGTGAPVAGPVDDLTLVREFYENLPDSPAAAFDLLAPELLSSSLGEFLQSWSRVVEIDSVDVVQRADGVLATVRMSLQDGGHLRLQQLLTVAESPRRIVGAQLLSAQRN